MKKSLRLIVGVSLIAAACVVVNSTHKSGVAFMAVLVLILLGLGLVISVKEPHQG